MKRLSTLVVLIGAALGLAFIWGSPPTPQPIYQNAEYAHWDVQVHNRNGDGTFTQWVAPMQAGHGGDCSPPPATHAVQDLNKSVFICAGHVMTSLWGQGYAEAMLTPSQLLDCSASCTVQWDMSTQRDSVRDWPDLWLTPWADNIALPFDEGDVDLQGIPRQGIHVNLQNGANNSFHAETISNYVATVLPYNAGVGIGQGITAGTNQAAVRQTFKLTVTPGHVRFERLASATATAVVWTTCDSINDPNCLPGWSNCACLLASDYVVQFGHHSYNPTKDNAGVPATWHWFNSDNPVLSPSVPFTLIHGCVKSTSAPCTLTDAQAVVANNNTSVQTVTFDSPSPANAFLRFSAVCAVYIDGSQTPAPKMTFVGHYEHASSYFVPIAAGKTSVTIRFDADGWFGPGFGCGAQDFHVWSKAGGPPSTPTPVPSPTPSPSTVPSPSPAPPTATLVPSPTLTPSPTSTAIPSTSTPTVVPPTGTPVPPTPTSTPPPVVCQQVVRVNGVTMYIDQAAAYCNGAHP